MKNYVIATLDKSDKTLYYYTDHGIGEYVISSIDEAMRFDYDEVFEYLKNNKNISEYGFTVVYVADVTFEKLKTDKDLCRKFSDPMYAIR